MLKDQSNLPVNAEPSNLVGIREKIRKTFAECCGVMELVLCPHCAISNPVGYTVCRGCGKTGVGISSELRKSPRRQWDEQGDETSKETSKETREETSKETSKETRKETRSNKVLRKSLDGIEEE